MIMAAECLFQVQRRILIWLVAEGRNRVAALTASYE
jgi:hypothetical protein